MQNIFFHLPLPTQFAWKPAEEDMVSNKANPLGKHVETPALEINASTENPLIDFTNRLGFFYPGSSRSTSAKGHTVIKMAAAGNAKIIAYWMDTSERGLIEQPSLFFLSKFWKNGTLSSLGTKIIFRFPNYLCNLHSMHTVGNQLSITRHKLPLLTCSCLIASRASDLFLYSTKP